MAQKWYKLANLQNSDQDLAIWIRGRQAKNKQTNTQKDLSKINWC